METPELWPVGRLALYAGIVVAATVGAGIWPARGVDRPAWRQTGLALAAGVMLGAAFLHMLPEAVREVGPEASYAVALGFVVLFLLERFVLVHACDVAPREHDHVHECELEHLAPSTLGLAAFVGFSLHTLVDGVALGSAMSAHALGPVVLLAIVLHKIPLSFSLASVLRYEGRSTGRVLFLVVVFALMVPVGAALFLAVASRLEAGRAVALTPWALAFSAGTFLHVAFSDLLPELHRQRAKALPAAGLVLLGLGLMLALTFVGEHHH